MVPRRTPGRHLRPFPSPNGALPHARTTFLPRSVAQWCRAARSGNTSARFRRPTVTRRTPGEHFCHYPSPNGALPHARATFLPRSVAQRCITARSGNTSTRFRRPTGHLSTPGRHFHQFPSPGRAGQGKRTGRSGTGKGKGTGTNRVGGKH